jgi:phosphoribosyl-AMP cyclohydrolase
MSNMVTQTQSSTEEVEVQNQEKLVPTLHQGIADIKLLSKVFEHKPMIQLTLDGRKAVINCAQKTIHVKRHYRNRKSDRVFQKNINIT